MKNKLFSLFLVAIASSAVFSQVNNNDAVLMTIGNDKVAVGEFLTVYKKNNAKGSTLDKKSLQEYLDLYTIFRLKVKEARELGIDTTKAFREELIGYKKTLSAPYLTEKDAIDNLTKEAYDRMQWDIRTSHILIKVDADATPQDTIEAFRRITLIKQFIEGKGNAATVKGYSETYNNSIKSAKASHRADTVAASNMKKMFALKTHDFASVAKAVSEHPSKSAGGDLGYLTGMAGMGYPYEYETAAYKAKQGEMTVVRTPMGYHLILITDKRPHKELHVAHLMLLFRKNMTHDDSVKIKMKIDSISGLLKKGENFEELVKKYTDHKETIKKGGDVGWISFSSNFPNEFKDAAFALKGNNSISDPVKTKFGWHIIKRLGDRNLPPFDSLKTDLKAKVQKDARSSVAKGIFLAKLKTQFAFKEEAKARQEFYKAVDSTLFMGKWQAEKVSAMNKPLFSISDKTYTQQDFAKYVEKNQHAGVQKNAQRIINSLYKQYTEEELFATKENHLEKDYPDFKTLMDEYRDGILLFNLTDQKVWSKAIKDTVGAKEFYEKNKGHFMWEDRLDASIYTCRDEKNIDKVKKMIKSNKSDKEILSALNKDTAINVSIESKLFLKGDNAMLDKTGWTPGVTGNETVKNKIVFANIRKVMKSTPKSYIEARGLITSEYQTWLEKQWIGSLKQKYPVSVDKKVFDSIQ
ncbi:MAG: peptidylprolyl isomerase [Bacteroidia bacterium]